MIVILYDMENMQRIIFYKMCLKYLTDGHDARKNCKIFFFNKMYVILY